MIDSKMKSDELPNWFIDLLILRATDRLDADQQRQFDRFVEEHPDCDRVKSKAEKYELAAAAIELNYHRGDADSIAELPSDLRDKLRDSARQQFQRESSPEALTPPSASADSTDSAGRSNMTSREATAWIAAAAAVILLMTGLNPFAGPSPSMQGPEVELVENESLENQLAAFKEATIEDRVSLPWTATATDSQATGNVVWSDSRQQGFMTFQGLAANDPSKSQYQLWIFDTDASQSYPVDGGVFDISGAGEIIVPIDAKIPVAKAVMFAITEEHPGGVVVSDRKRLPLLAKVDS